MNYDALMGFEIPEARQDPSAPSTRCDTRSPSGSVTTLSTRGSCNSVDDHKGRASCPRSARCSAIPASGWPIRARPSMRAGSSTPSMDSPLKGPIPSAGTVVGDTRIVDIVDKGAAKGALLYLEKTLRDDGTGAVIATETRTLMLRGDGGYDGPSGTPRPAREEPDEPPDRTLTVATRPEQALLYRLNGDPNPLHLDPAVAQKRGLRAADSPRALHLRHRLPRPSARVRGRRSRSAPQHVRALLGAGLSGRDRRGGDVAKRRLSRAGRRPQCFRPAQRTCDLRLMRPHDWVAAGGPGVAGGDAHQQ